MQAGELLVDILVVLAFAWAVWPCKKSQPDSGARLWYYAWHAIKRQHPELSASEQVHAAKVLHSKLIALPRGRSNWPAGLASPKMTPDAGHQPGGGVEGEDVHELSHST